MSTMRTTIAFILLLCIPPTASSWSGEQDEPHHADLAELVLRALDPRQAAPIRGHLDAYRRGALDAETELPPEYHRYSPDSGAGRALDHLANATVLIQENLTARNAIAEDARQLGIIVHVLFDLTQPLHTGNGTIDAPYHAEYETAAAKNAATPTLSNFAPQRGNVTDLARDIARTSARRAADLEALLADEGPWSSRIANITDAALHEGAPLVANTLANILPTPPGEGTPPSRAGTPAGPRENSPTSTASPATPQPTVVAPTTAPNENTSPARETPVSIFAILVGCILALIVKSHARARR